MEVGFQLSPAWGLTLPQLLDLRAASILLSCLLLACSSTGPCGWLSSIKGAGKQ